MIANHGMGANPSLYDQRRQERLAYQPIEYLTALEPLRYAERVRRGEFSVISKPNAFYEPTAFTQTLYNRSVNPTHSRAQLDKRNDDLKNMLRRLQERRDESWRRAA